MAATAALLTTRAPEALALIVTGAGALMSMRADEERPLTSQDANLALLYAVLEKALPKRKRRSGKRRKAKLLIDQSIEMLKAPAECPAPNVLRVVPIDPSTISHRMVCADALSDLERIRPLVKALVRG